MDAFKDDLELIQNAKTFEEAMALLNISPVSPEAYYFELAWRKKEAEENA